MEPATLPELNAVLVGSKGSWKHLVGNIILGRDCMFTTDISAKSEKREGTACGRKVTLVKAPSWWRGYPLCDTPALFQTEMTLCTPLCPAGGPHAILLVINTNLVFKESYQRATVEHLEELYGHNVWDHTIIVFCSGRNCPAIDDYIQSQGTPLRSLMEKCSKRYHVLCNGDMNSEEERREEKVKELFVKIDAMVSANGRYESDVQLMQSAERKREEVDQKADRMRLTSQTQKQKLRALITGGWRPELKVLLLGWVFSGKSKAANAILNADKFQAGSRTLESTMQSGEVDGRKVTIVDTPGWWKFFPAMFTSQDVKSEVQRAVSLCSPSPNVILLMFPPSTSFTEEQLEITLDNMKLLGKNVWRHVIVVFTFGDCLEGYTIEHHIASEGKPLCKLIELCGNRYHCLRSKNKDRTQVTELLEKMEEMAAGNFYLSSEPERDEEPPNETAGGKNVDEGFDDEVAKEVNHELDIGWDRENWDKRHVSQFYKRRGSLEKLRPNMGLPTAYSTLREREWNRQVVCIELNLEEDGSEHCDGSKLSKLSTSKQDLTTFHE